MKRLAIVYESVTGNTAMLAEALRSSLSQRNAMIVPADQIDIDSYDVFFVGSYTDKGDSNQNISNFLEKLHNKDVFLFGTCGFGGTDTYYETVISRFASHLPQDNRIIGQFMCQGKMPEEVLKRYEIMKAANPDNDRWTAWIENYHQALTHPDGKDLRDLCDAAKNALIAI